MFDAAAVHSLRTVMRTLSLQFHGPVSQKVNVTQDVCWATQWIAKATMNFKRYLRAIGFRIYV